MGHAALVCGPPHAGACCGGVWPPAWWGVVCWRVARLIVGRGVVVCGPLHGGVWCADVWPPSWCGMLRWCYGLEQQQCSECASRNHSRNCTAAFEYI